MQNSRKSKKIVVGLSGGVDSSVALILLKKQGWQPLGVSLKLPVWKDRRNTLKENICCTRSSLQRARDICQKLAVPYFIVDARQNFQKEVVNYFVSEFKRARTPNPCIVCNHRFKFRKLFEFARKHKIKYAATGHYGRLLLESPRAKNQKPKYRLLKAEDKNKDQSYFLSCLPQKWLNHIVFPLGNKTKKEVYQTAKKEGLWFFTPKNQSQDFCFVSCKSLRFFLQKEIGEEPGKILDSEGRVLGEHRGLHFYTIGQRKGLGIAGGPYFVRSLDKKRNLLTVSRDKKEVNRKEIMLSPFNFISGKPPKRKIIVSAKTRYQQTAGRAVLHPPVKDKLKIIFEKPQFAAAPGQFCVFYQKNICLGAGTIMSDDKF